MLSGVIMATPGTHEISTTTGGANEDEHDATHRSKAKRIFEGKCSAMLTDIIIPVDYLDNKVNSVLRYHGNHKDQNHYTITVSYQPYSFAGGADLDPASGKWEVDCDVNHEKTLLDRSKNIIFIELPQEIAQQVEDHLNKSFRKE